MGGGIRHRVQQYGKPDVCRQYGIEARSRQADARAEQRDHLQQDSDKLVPAKALRTRTAGLHRPGLPAAHRKRRRDNPSAERPRWPTLAAWLSRSGYGRKISGTGRRRTTRIAPPSVPGMKRASGKMSGSRRSGQNHVARCINDAIGVNAPARWHGMTFGGSMPLAPKAASSAVPAACAEKGQHSISMPEAAPPGDERQIEQRIARCVIADRHGEDVVAQWYRSGRGWREGRQSDQSIWQAVVIAILRRSAASMPASAAPCGAVRRLLDEMRGHEIVAETHDTQQDRQQHRRDQRRLDRRHATHRSGTEYLSQHNDLMECASLCCVFALREFVHRFSQWR
ncbi:unnamed protein product [Acanthosepion pharaonis]|uniref:Uncharacterized protein n=1 Tax=Acanthosepion pharaonis TaxID=158019 RepID=A0A812DDJ5_ACAPH|nr:unnamed protein product [Sepia pharaonis]